MDSASTQPRVYSPQDFLYGPALGSGRFGTIVYAELKKPAVVDASVPSHDAERRGRRGYAVKVIPKSKVMRRKQAIQAVMLEKYILSEVLPRNEGPSAHLIMKLFLCFHDASSLYLVLELCAGGTLFDLIQSRAAGDEDGSSPIMDISWVRYYAGQILRAIEYLHQRGIVHRDVSTQNICIIYPNGNIKLGDFGAAAVFEKRGEELRRHVPTGTPPLGQDSASDFVGTADYVSPEMLRGTEEGVNDQNAQYETYPAMDLWALGCIIYEMFVGQSPFHAASDHLAFQNVLEYANDRARLLFPPLVDGCSKTIISSLLSISPSSRLGARDGVICSSAKCVSTERPTPKQYLSVREHAFFYAGSLQSSIWDLIESKESIEPPYRPAEPAWMSDLNRGDGLAALESIQFDL